MHLPADDHGIHDPKGHDLAADRRSESDAGFDADDDAVLLGAHDEGPRLRTRCDSVAQLIGEHLQIFGRVTAGVGHGPSCIFQLADGVGLLLKQIGQGIFGRQVDLGQLLGLQNAAVNLADLELDLLDEEFLGVDGGTLVRPLHHAGRVCGQQVKAQKGLVLLYGLAHADEDFGHFRRHGAVDRNGERAVGAPLQDEILVLGGLLRRRKLRRKLRLWAQDYRRTCTKNQHDGGDEASFFPVRHSSPARIRKVACPWRP